MGHPFGPACTEVRLLVSARSTHCFLKDSEYMEGAASMWPTKATLCRDVPRLRWEQIYCARRHAVATIQGQPKIIMWMMHINHLLGRSCPVMQGWDWNVLGWGFLWFKTKNTFQFFKFLRYQISIPCLLKDIERNRGQPWVCILLKMGRVGFARFSKWDTLYFALLGH